MPKFVNLDPHHPPPKRPQPFDPWCPPAQAPNSPKPPKR